MNFILNVESSEVGEIMERLSSSRALYREGEVEYNTYIQEYLGCQGAFGNQMSRGYV